MEGGLLLDVVVGKGTAVLELLSGKDQPLLVWGDSLLVLNFGLNVVNCIGALDLKGDGLADPTDLFNRLKQRHVATADRDHTAIESFQKHKSNQTKGTEITGHRYPWIMIQTILTIILKVRRERMILKC
ncbi:hypothetical protein LXL04_027130 [Taraxacum kok-saghyz]